MNIDAKTMKLVAAMLGAAFIAIIVSMAVLAGFDKDYPGVFDNILTGLLTGLLGLLISARSEDPVDVNVTNEPVATTEVPATKRKRSDRGHTDLDRAVAVAALVLVLLVICGVLAS